ncbi:MAG: MFS transporter [Candidatus Lokiarchaeota archaeon]|nr:MFS transporter [Candidatus Lokiarchaeota archaeon]
MKTHANKSTVIHQFVILMTIFIDATGYAMIRPLFSFYVLSFNLGAVALSLLMIMFALMQFIFSPILGRLSDKYGRRSLLLISISISSVSFLLFTLASSYWMLLLSRMISGMATEIPIAQAYMADITTSKNRTSGLGKVRAAFSAGVIIGPSMGGLLSVFGYWSTGLLAILLTLINLISVYFFLPEPKLEKKEISVQISQKNTFTKNLKNAFTKPLLPSLLLILFVMIMAFSAIPVLIPLIGIEFFNFNEIELAFVFMIIGGFQFVTQGFLMGKLSQKFGEGILIIVGIIFVIIGIFWMPIFPILIIFYILVALLSTGGGLVRTSIPSLISKISGEDEQGGFLGLAQSVVSFAFIPGPLLAGFFYDYIDIAAPFFFSSLLLLGSLILSIKVYFQIKKL